MRDRSLNDTFYREVDRFFYIKLFDRYLDDGEEVRLILLSLSIDLVRVEELKTVFSKPFISFDFYYLFLKLGRPSKSSSMLRSTSLLKVFIEKLRADYFASVASSFSNLLSHFGAEVRQMTGIYFGIPCFGFIN